MVGRNSADRDVRSNISWREQLLAIFGTSCAKCGYNTDTRALKLDHVQGNGLAECRKLGGAGVVRRAFAHPQDYQLLCANCCAIKSAVEMAELNQLN